MATVDTILSRKGGEVVSVSPQACVLDAALLMNAWRVGCVLVLDDGQLAGVFTERDVLRRVVAQGKSPADTTIQDVMTTGVVCCQPDATLQEARAIFKQRRIRHLPVVGVDGQIMGLISIGDLNAWELRGQEVELVYLREYLYGQV